MTNPDELEALAGQGINDPPCTDCGNTGWCFQTEKHCTCGAPPCLAYEGDGE